MKKIVTAVLLSACFVTPALADGFYGALDVGQASGADICSGLPAGVTGCKDSATLFRGAVGTQITPIWGAEVSYGSYGKASAGTLGPLSVDWEMSGLQVSGTGTFPLSDAFFLIGKLGIAQTDLKITANCVGCSISETSTNLAFGIGAQYAFTPGVAIRAQYEDLGTVGNANTTGTSKVTLLSVGAVLKF